jgi:hypothetical protein
MKKVIVNSVNSKGRIEFEKITNHKVLIRIDDGLISYGLQIESVKIKELIKFLIKLL